MPAVQKLTRCLACNEEELFAYGNFLVPKGAEMRATLLKHFSRRVKDHRDHRVARTLKEADLATVLPYIRDNCADDFFHQLKNGAPTLAIHRELAILVTLAKTFASIANVFLVTKKGQRKIEEFTQQCDGLLDVRRASGQPLPDVGEVRIAGRQLEESSTGELSVLLESLGQQKVDGWEETLPADVFVRVKKLGEGQYGEVFQTTLNGDPVALKVLPFTDHKGGFTGTVNGDLLKGPKDVLTELVATRELANLSTCTANRTSSFIGLNGAWVVQGVYPAGFLDAWDEFSSCKKTYNDRPDNYAVDGQLFLCLALSLGGSDLEAYKIEGHKQATSILLQVMWSLMVAEKELRFEHRDLHQGNVLVEKTAEDSIDFRLDDMLYSIRAYGVKVEIIDFTMSRMEKGNMHIYLDVSSDLGLFRGPAAPQFDVYRLMRTNNGMLEYDCLRLRQFAKDHVFVEKLHKVYIKERHD